MQRKRLIAANPPAAGLARGVASKDRISGITISHVVVPLSGEISDAKVLTGRQKPLTTTDILLVEMTSDDGFEGMGFSYTLRVGGPAMFAYAAEIGDSLLGEDPNDISRLWSMLAWRGASIGRSGLANEVIAAFDSCLWDMKARRAGLPLAKLLGAHRDSVRVYNTSGQYLSSTVEQMKEAAAASIARGIGGIKVKIGQPDPMEDLARLDALRSHLGDAVPMMIDANQQWDRPTAMRFGKIVDDMGFVFIEEPLDARDYEGHGELARALSTPIATGEMLTSVEEVAQLIAAGGADILQADAPRIGGITPFLKVMNLAEAARINLAPHMVMEQHLHLAAAFPTEPWVEHFEWLEPLFNERLHIEGGRMHIADRPGLGFTVSQEARGWTKSKTTLGKRP